MSGILIENHLVMENASYLGKKKLKHMVSFIEMNKESLLCEFIPYNKCLDRETEKIKMYDNGQSYKCEQQKSIDF